MFPKCEFNYIHILNIQRVKNVCRLMVNKLHWSTYNNWLTCAQGHGTVWKI